MIKFFARVIVLLGQVLIGLTLVVALVIGLRAITAGQTEFGLAAIAGGVLTAMLLAAAVFGLAALLEICDRLEELVAIAKKVKTAPPQLPNGRPAPAASDGDWLDALPRKK